MNVYLLGSRGPLAGVTAPPGLYFQNDLYLNEGSLGAARQLQSGGRVIAGVDARSWINLPTLAYVAPGEVLGGSVGISYTQPFGRPRVTAGLGIDPAGPIGAIGGRITDAATSVGDPFVSTSIGWRAGNFHWSLIASGNIPVGGYRVGEISNVALNRPAFDITGALTYFDQERGFEVSLVPGFTFNGENRATNYRTGTEFHLEGSASLFLTKQLSVGVIGYHYRQITDDGGSGARLGAFRGRASAVGGTIGYTFLVGQTPISTRLKVFREFDVENRLEGTTAYLTVSLPLWVPQTSVAPPVRAKF